MSCATCEQNSTDKKTITLKLNAQKGLFGANDIEVYDGTEVRPLFNSDWDENRHKLLLFYPHTFTPVCTSEMGALPQWIPAFEEQNVDVFSVTADDIQDVKDWYDSEPALGTLNYRALSSMYLVIRMGLLEKRASVFITNEGEIVKQEHFDRVGRSLAELHRMIYAYNTGSYCAEGWTSPADGFLEKK